MILNKHLSLGLTACFFIMLMFFVGLILRFVLHISNLSYLGAIVIIAAFVLSRSFYYFLRNDDKYKNTRKRTSDVKGERYLIKGEKDFNKIFIILWVIIMLIITFSAYYFTL